MVFKILLYHEAAHRMADQHRRRRQAVDHGGDIAHVVGDRKAVEVTPPRRAAVAGQAQCVGGIAGLGEEGRKWSSQHQAAA
jgi:hypothetical protein